MRLSLNRLSPTLFLWSTLPNPPASDQRAFDERCDERLGQHARVVTAAILFMVVAFWPTDLVALSGVPGAASAFAKWRLSAAIGTTLFLVASRPSLAPRWQLALFALFLGGGFVGVAWSLATLGGLDQPWLHFIYIFPLTTIALPLRLSVRVAFTGLLSALPLAAIFLAFPAYRDSPLRLIVCVHMSSLIGVSVIFGELLMRLLKQNFLQAQELARRTLALSEHRDLLETRVADQTRELRQLLHHVETAQEVERARIGRELHDELGQELTALRYALTTIRHRCADDAGPLARELDALERQVARTGETARALVTELRPRILDDLGLAEAARWLVARLEQRAGIACAIDLRGESERVEVRQATVAFRVLQEALTNAFRHADADRVEVTLHIGAELIDLRVCDDGVGLERAAQRGLPGGGMGLLGMRERAAAIGGEVRIGDRPGGGTEVRCRLPVGAPGEERAS